MKKQILMACLAAAAFCAHAGPVTFFDVQFDVTAIASGDGAPGFDSQSGPPSATPLSASAASGSLDIATAGAIAGPGLLSTSADVSGGGGIASSVATSHFVGSFLNSGFITLNIDFTALDIADDTGDAGTSLFVLLTSGGVTLFQDYITGPWAFAYDPAAGTSVLDLTLSSQASAGFPAPGVGSGSSFGLVSFTGTVPEASSLLLLSLGLGMLLAVRPGARRRTVSG